MIYLSGSTNNAIEPFLIDHGIGLMCQPGNGYSARVLQYRYWAVDIVGMNGTVTPDMGVDWLAQLMPADSCLFATSPDAYPDAVESQRRGLEYAPLIRELGFPVAIVAQDGAERLSWPWEDFDCLFIGGEQRWPGRSEWKESETAAHLVKRARNAGKWVHMGRVNTPRRLGRAWRMGVLSADGTLIKYLRRLRAGETPDQRDQRFLREIHTFARALDHPPLPLERWETPSHPEHRKVAL